MTTLKQVQDAARAFLNLADELNQQVTRYIDGSNEHEDFIAYYKVKQADRAFIDALNDYAGSVDYTSGLNYELAKSVLEQ